MLCKCAKNCNNYFMQQHVVHLYIYMNLIINKFVQHIIDIDDQIMLNIIDNTVFPNMERHVFSYLIGLIIGQQEIRFRLYGVFNSKNFTPEQILNLTNEQWNHINIDENKKQTIINASNYALNKNMYDKNVIQEMQFVHGIGAWTISCLLIQFCMLNDEFIINDVYVNNKLKLLYKIDITDPNNISQFVERWAPYKSHAFYCLWRFELP